MEQYLGDRATGLDETIFWSDQRTQDAVLRRMETLADAASHLSDALRARHPTIPWRQIADFRNVLAHAYTEIRLDRVWQVIEGDLPQLRSVLDQELGRSE